MMTPEKKPYAMFFSLSPILTSKRSPILKINSGMEEQKDLRKMSYLIFVEESMMIYRMYKGEMDIYVIRFHALKCNMKTIPSA